MKHRTFVRLQLLGLALVCSITAGCGVKTVKVHGKLTYGATALTGKDHQPIVVVFCPYNGEGQSDGRQYDVEFNQDSGAYETAVPVGRYRICVSSYGEDLDDKFRGVFAPGQSPIIRDIQNSSEINLDLQKLQREAKPAAPPGTVSTAMPP